MATNPMQRQARNSFMLGMIITLSLALVAGVFLAIHIKNLHEQLQQIEDNKQNVYVLNQDVKSGQVLTKDMFTTMEVDKTGIPADATGKIDTILAAYSLSDSENHPITMKNDGNSSSYYYSIKIDNKEYVIYTTDSDGNENVATTLSVEDTAYYFDQTTTSNKNSKSGNKVNITLAQNAVIAKTDMMANTVITRSLVRRAEETQTSDLREQEYNVVVLPTDLITGDYVDIRLMLPNGEDFIVASKKMVTIPTANGETMSDTIKMNLTEDETLSMSCAIVEAFEIEGSKLYATKYTDAGNQDAATPTYVVNSEVAKLMDSDPNITSEAKVGLKSRYTEGLNSVRNNQINSAISNYGDEDKIKDGMEESITSTQENRKEYLQGLTSTTTTTTTSTTTTNTTSN